MTDIIRMEVKAVGSETDMDILEQKVRHIQMDGLKWGSSYLEEIGYGIKKLIIDAIVDSEIGQDDIIELIEAEDEYVQSVDVVSRNKC